MSIHLVYGGFNFIEKIVDSVLHDRLSSTRNFIELLGPLLSFVDFLLHFLSIKFLLGGSSLRFSLPRDLLF